MKLKIYFVIILAVLFLLPSNSPQSAPLYSISLTNAGDITAANDILIHLNGNEAVNRIAARRGYQATIPDPADPNKDDCQSTIERPVCLGCIEAVCQR